MSVDWGKAMRPTVHDLVEATNGNTDYIEDTLPGLLAGKVSDSAIGTLLWSGSLNTGSITVPRLSNYRLFAVKLDSELSTLIVASMPNDTWFVGGGFDITTTPTLFVLAARCTRNGNDLTYVNAGYINAAGTTITTRAITAIYGII